MSRIGSLVIVIVSSHTPWVHEPDFWTEDDGEFHLLAIRYDGRGHWCGYLGLPMRYANEITDDIKVHGGWTGSLRVDGLARAGYSYAGFDCDHGIAMRDGYADLSPRDHGLGLLTYGKTERRYRPLAYVIGELRGAVVQLRRQRSWWKRLLRWLGRRGR